MHRPSLLHKLENDDSHSIQKEDLQHQDRLAKVLMFHSKGASDTDTVQVTVKGNGGGEQGVQSDDGGTGGQEEQPIQKGQGTGNTVKECAKGQGPDPDTGQCVLLPS